MRELVIQSIISPINTMTEHTRVAFRMMTKKENVVEEILRASIEMNSLLEETTTMVLNNCLYISNLIIT